MMKYVSTYSFLTILLLDLARRETERDREEETDRQKDGVR